MHLDTVGHATAVEVHDPVALVLAQVHGSVGEGGLLRQLRPGRGGQHRQGFPPAGGGAVGLSHDDRPAVLQEGDEADLICRDVSVQQVQELVILRALLRLGLPPIEGLASHVIVEVLPGPGIGVVSVPGQLIGLAPVLGGGVDGPQLAGVGIVDSVPHGGRRAHRAVGQQGQLAAPEVLVLHGEQDVQGGVQHHDLPVRADVNVPLGVEEGASRIHGLDPRLLLKAADVYPGDLRAGGIQLDVVVLVDAVQ